MLKHAQSHVLKFLETEMARVIKYVIIEGKVLTLLYSLNHGETS